MNRKQVSLKDAKGMVIGECINMYDGGLLIAANDDAFVLLTFDTEDRDDIKLDDRWTFNRHYFNDDDLKRVFDEATILKWEEEEKLRLQNQEKELHERNRREYERLRKLFDPLVAM